jgi:hypothetical protein
MRLGSRRFHRFSLLVDPEPARQLQPTLVTDAFCTASFNIVFVNSAVLPTILLVDAWINLHRYFLIFVRPGNQRGNCVILTVRL